MKKISIICVYNRTSILKNQLMKSLQKQTVDYELILIDNRNNTFKNAATALNHGAKKATGEFLIFIQQNIILNDPKWIEKTIKEVKNLKKPGIIGVAGKTNTSKVVTNILTGNPPKKASKFNLKKPEKASTLDECLLIIPNKIFNSLKFDEKNCFDWQLHTTDYVLSVKKLGFEAYIIPTTLIKTTKNKNLSNEYYKTIKKLQLKHFSEKIIRSTSGDWYTFIPLHIQIKMKSYNEKNNYIKLNFIDKYFVNKENKTFYHEVDPRTYEIIKNSDLFDADYYVTNYHINKTKYDPLSHFLTVGYRNNYNPSIKFDTTEYFEKNLDVKKADMNPLYHYITYGQYEGRKKYPVKTKKRLIKNILLKYAPNITTYLLFKSKLNLTLFKRYKKEYDIINNSKLFNIQFYNCYPHGSEFQDPISHYMFIGHKLGYEPNDYFDGDYYKNKYKSDDNPLITYLKYERNMPIKFKKIDPFEHELIKNSGLFNEEYYMENYPNTKKYSSNLISHYMNIGFKLGYNPSEYFDTNWYLETYTSVKNANINPLFHYLQYGQYEKRIPKPLTKEEANNIINKLESITKKEKLVKFDENSPLVSIIILTRNGLDYLKTLFKNFKDTIGYPNYEIIVVDNDSSDETINYLKKISKELPIRIIENKFNETFSEANNKGVKISKGEYILLLNNDMKPLYGWLNHMMSTYLSSDDIGIVGAKLIYPYRENNPTSLTTQNEGIKYNEMNGFLEKNDGFIVPYNIKENRIFNNDTENQEIASVLGAAILIKKDLYHEVGGLDKEYFYNYEDIDLCFKVIQKGYKVIYSPKAKLYHYYQATRKEAFDLSPTDMKNRITLYQKWNTWLSEQLFIDKLENKLIFSEKPLKIAYISKEHNLLKQDPSIFTSDINNYQFTEKFLPNHKGIMNNLGWEITPMKHKNGEIHLKNNTDIVLTDITTFHPNNIRKNNKHQINILVINDKVEKVETLNNTSKYDMILTTEKYYNNLKGKNHVYLLKNYKSIFKQIKDILKKIYKNNINEFNDLIKNYNFEETIPYGKNYNIIKNSEFFDENWYTETYDISNDHLDPINHYLKIGGLNGFNPSEKFNSNYYYLQNPDVKSAKMNPLLHYELYGKNENRQFKCSEEDINSYNKFLSLTKKEKYNSTKNSFKINKKQIFFYSPWSEHKNGPLNENSQMIFDNLDEKYKKVIYTSKRIAVGDYYELLKNALESNIIIMDQGWGWLSEYELKEEQKVINIWHACGAFKKIGYDAPVYNDWQLDRFGKQFSQYTNFIVSSPKIENIYANAHGMAKKDVLGLGVPRTDLFFDENYKKTQIKKLYEKYPYLKDKEIILYAPTFRDNYAFDTKIDWDRLSQELDPNEVIIIKRHIMTKEDILHGKKYGNIFYIEDEIITLFTLMFASKMMISDYSSVIFEYCLLNKPVIHYCPDYDKYLSVRDFYLDFDTELYGEIVKDSEELIEKIINKDYILNIKKLEKFKDKFMSSCDGHATERVVKLIEKYMEE